MSSLSPCARRSSISRYNYAKIIIYVKTMDLDGSAKRVIKTGEDSNGRLGRADKNNRTENEKILLRMFSF